MNVAVAAPSLSALARLGERQEHRREAVSQVLTLDYFQIEGPLEDYAAFTGNGLWIRHRHAFPAGTRVVLHLVLPELLARVAVEGRVIRARSDGPLAAAWMLIWFDEPYGDDYELLRQVLPGHGP